MLIWYIIDLLKRLFVVISLIRGYEKEPLGPEPSPEDLLDDTSSPINNTSNLEIVKIDSNVSNILNVLEAKNTSYTENATKNENVEQVNGLKFVGVWQSGRIL